MENKLTDKGWTAMRRMLDREMPEKRRRRFGWWWFAGLLLPVAAYGGWLAWQSQTVPGKESDTTPVQAIAGVLHTSPDQVTTNPETHSEASITGIEISSPKTLGIPNRDRQAVSTTLKVANQQNAETNPLVTATIIPAPETAVSLIENAVPTTPAPALSTVMCSLANPTPVTSLAAPAIIKTPLVQPLTSRTSRKSGQSRWAIGATSVLTTEQFNQINGFSTGMTLDWHFARKWGLRTGLLYNIHSPQEQSRPVATVQPETYGSNVDGQVIIVDLVTGNETVGVSPDSYVDSLNDNVIIPVNRLQRLEIPVTAFWQPVSYFKLLGGLSFSRTLSAKADRQNYSGEYLLKLTDQKSEDGASKLSSGELNNWSADAMLGAGFRIGKSFELGCSAKMAIRKSTGLRKVDSSGSFNNPLTSDRAVNSGLNQNKPVFSLYGTLYF